MVALNRPTAVIGEDFRLAALIRAADRVGLRYPRDLGRSGIADTPYADALQFPSVSRALTSLPAGPSN